MSSSPRAEKTSKDSVGSSTFRSEFEGYYPPTEDALQRFVAEGLVVLDTNAVLDLYRFTDTTREEYFDALRLLGDRLWIPNRVGEEFYDRRTSVIRDRQGIRSTIAEQTTQPLEALAGIAAIHAQRHGLDGDATATAVREGVLAALEPVIREIEGTVGGVTIDPDAHPDEDPILTQICELFDNKTGTAFTDKQSSSAWTAHKIRLAGHVPPGYCDDKKEERAIGDFLVWKQTMDQATTRKLPVLLVTNETKPDWVFRDRRFTMPRVELVREMKKTAGCDFHLVDVQTFLALAKAFLAAQVSEASVDEAARVSAATNRETANIRATMGTYDATAGIRTAIGNYDPTAHIRAVMGNYDATADIRTAIGNYDPTENLRVMMGNYDPTAHIRAVMGNYDATAGIRAAIGNYDPTENLRVMMGTPASGLSPKTRAKTPAVPQKKSASTEAATKRVAAAKKPGTKNKRVTKDKAAE